MNSSNSTSIGSGSSDSSSITWDLYVITCLCTFGVIANLINIAVFLNPKLKDQTYRYMMMNSISELLYLFFNGLSIVFLCGPSCDANYNSLLGQIFSIYLFGFLPGALVIFNILIEIYLSFQRLMILSNRSFLKKVPVLLVLFVLFTISFIYNIPNLISQRIAAVPTSAPGVYTYMAMTTDFGYSNLASVLKQIMKYLRIFLTLGVLLVLNILTAYKSRQHFMKKSQMKNAFNSSNKRSSKLGKRKNSNFIGY